MTTPAKHTPSLRPFTLPAMTDVRMIDVGGKEPTRRRALARAEVHMSDEALAKIEDGTVAKGDVLATARVAGIAASNGSRAQGDRT